MTELKQTPLYEFHKKHGAKLVPFAGYEMPVQYPAGIKTEHLFCREQAGLFDVSHMGQILVQASNAGQLLESLIPGNYIDLKPGRQRYGLLTNESGGVDDDLMVARLQDDAYLLVVNAACKQQDFDRLHSQLGDCVSWFSARALLAIQGPLAEQALTAQFPALAEALANMIFMDVLQLDFEGHLLIISRSGYTGEDGFEISIPEHFAEEFAERLLQHEQLQPIGLGARDSLRLEAGLCLYGHELNAHISPVEANLVWAISPLRRPGGERAGGYPGSDVIAEQIENGVRKQRVGLLPQGRAPVRDGTEIFNAEGESVGLVCSGGYGPTVAGPIAMAFVNTDVSHPGTELFARVRGKDLPVTVAALPFVPAGYKR